MWSFYITISPCVGGALPFDAITTSPLTVVIVLGFQQYVMNNMLYTFDFLTTLCAIVLGETMTTAIKIAIKIATV